MTTTARTLVHSKLMYRELYHWTSPDRSAASLRNDHTLHFREGPLGSWQPLGSASTAAEAEAIILRLRPKWTRHCYSQKTDAKAAIAKEPFYNGDSVSWDGVRYEKHQDGPIRYVHMALYAMRHEQIFATNKNSSVGPFDMPAPTIGDLVDALAWARDVRTDLLTDEEMAMAQDALRCMIAEADD